MEYEASSLIEASPDTIWPILTDASGYSDWDSGVERVEGTIAPGEKIKVYSEALSHREPRRAAALRREREGTHARVAPLRSGSRSTPRGRR